MRDLGWWRAGANQGGGEGVSGGKASLRVMREQRATMLAERVSASGVPQRRGDAQERARSGAKDKRRTGREGPCRLRRRQTPARAAAPALPWLPGPTSVVGPEREASRRWTKSSQRSPPAAHSADRPSVSSEDRRPRSRRLITTRSSSPAAAPPVRNPSISSGSPPWAVIKPVSARWSSSNGNRVCILIRPPRCTQG